MKRLLPFLAVSFWVLVPAAGAVSVSGTPLMSMPGAAQSITAYDGYVVFSQGDAAQKSWRLTVWHTGTTRELRVAPQAEPFDVSAGPDSAHRPAIVYDRCTPGCHVYELSLPNGVGHLVRGIYDASASDTSPSIWNGAIAFARSYPHSRTYGYGQVLLWHSGHPITRLQAGPRPPCAKEPECFAGSLGVSTQAQQLSLGPDGLSFVWRMTGPTVWGTGGAETLLVDPVGQRQWRLDTGVFGDVCAGGFGADEAPQLVGHSVLWFDDWGDPCDQAERTQIHSFDLRSHRWFATPVMSGPLAAAIAADGQGLYWIAVTPIVNTVLNDGPEPMNPGDCVQPVSCELTYSTQLPLKAQNTTSEPQVPIG